MKEFNNKQVVTSQTPSESTPQQGNLKTDIRLTVADYPKEFGGRKEGLEPTRYGDWEKNGRCIDF